MKFVSARKMQRIDRKAYIKYGIPPIILMENAACVSAYLALRMLKPGESRVAIFCGQGNNGGDGLACARHLINHGLKVRVYFTGKIKKMSNETKTNYKIIRKMGLPFLKPKLKSLKKELNNADLIVDALLGIGLKSKVRQPIYSLIELINGSRKPVLSLDIPSGMDATSGKVYGTAIKARRTVTFGLVKKYFLNPQAKKYVGKLTIGDIGLPRQFLS